jgi:hypothetical protein
VYVRKNGAITQLGAGIPALATGVFDIGGGAPFQTGDLISLQIDASGATLTGAFTCQASMVYY